MANRLRGLVILTENDTLIEPGDLDGMVALAKTAEEAGIDAVMLGDHVCLGPSAGRNGRPQNPRAYAAPGNQDPATHWPSPIVLASAIASTTTSVRIALAALITPLRNPVVLAKDLATLDQLSGGRLIVQPTVSWSSEEYASVGIPFHRRGRILDDGIAAMKALWSQVPASYHGDYVSFEDTYCVPGPVRAEGPPLWFGGQSIHDAVLRRLVEHGSGFHPFGGPTNDDFSRLRRAFAAAGRSIDELEIVGGTRAVFEGSDDVANLDLATSDFEQQIANGVTTFCMKPAQHTDRFDDVADLCRLFNERLASLDS